MTTDYINLVFGIAALVFVMVYCLVDGYKQHLSEEELQEAREDLYLRRYY